MNPYWSEKDIELIRKLANEGKSSTKIAAYFPDRTRNSVIGVCNRRGIPLGVRTAQNTSSTVRKKLRKPNKQKKIVFGSGESYSNLSLPPLAISDEPDAPYTPMNKKILKLDFLFEQCRAVLGPVKGLDTLYCGNETVKGKSWCKHHMALYTIPRTQKKETHNDQFEKSQRR